VIRRDLSNAEYHAHPAISKSGLDRIDQSPAHYRASLVEPRKETPTLTFGSAAHCSVLESNEYLNRYTVAPDGIDRRTKEGKAAWSELESSGKTILSADDWQKIIEMNCAIADHQVANELLADGIAESSGFAELLGVPVKCRPDWLHDNSVIVDLKTTDNAGPNAFAKSCASYRYHVQAAFYSDICREIGLDIKAFVFIAVEKAPPYAVSVYELDSDSIKVGRTLYQRNLETYRRCLETDHWPAYSQSIETLSLPRWAMIET
jgi:exodeoxyribonuclease VIII